MRLLIAGGGTGGHLYPGVAVAQELLRRGGHQVHFAGSATGIEARVLPEIGLPFTPIRCGALVGIGLSAKLRGVANTLLGILDSRRLVKKYRPDAVLGVGGYASFPMAAASRLGGVFTAIQEQNATPGLANRVLGRIVHKIYAGDDSIAEKFPNAEVAVFGTPIRNAFAAPFPYEPPRSGEPVRILVLGGSQGAAPLNRIVPEALGLIPYPLSIRHQAGRTKEEAVKTAYAGRTDVKVETFITDMGEAYDWAQVVISRSGALTLAELAGAGRPSILVPFPFAAGNHQEANASAYEKAGAGVCVVERELTPEKLAGILTDWIVHPEKPASIAASAARWAKRDAARLIVDDLVAHAGGGN